MKTLAELTGEVLTFLVLLSQVCLLTHWDDRIATARQRTITLILTLQADKAT